MVSENYKPSMKPTLEAARVVRGTEVPARIRVSGPYLNSLRSGLASEDKVWLSRNVAGSSICPEQYWFEDTVRARELLKVHPQTPAKSSLTPPR